MKKSISLVLVVTVLLLSVVGLTACQQDEVETLVVYNWADYIYDQEQLGEDFANYYKQKTGKDIRITYVTFDTNETMLTKITKGDSNIDVMCPSEYAIQRLIEGDYLERINYFTDPMFENADKVNDAIVQKVRASFAAEGYDIAEYFVPYMWGTLGILYNSDVISEEQARNAGWGLLWNTNGNGLVSEKLTKKIYMKNSIRDSYVAVVMYMKEYGLLPAGYENMPIEQLINNTDDALLLKAEEVLKAQKPQLYGYEVDLGKDDLISQRAYVDLAWSGDAFYAIEEAAERGINLAFFTPEVGANIWFDGWVIPKSANNKQAAKLFIDFLNDPVIAMKNMMEIGYTTAVDRDVLLANQEAMEQFALAYAENPEDVEEVESLIDWFFNDVERYPEVMDARLGMMHDFGADGEKVFAMWSRVRAEGVSVTSTIIVLVVAAVIIAAVVIFVAKKRHASRRRIVRK